MLIHELLERRFDVSDIGFGESSVSLPLTDVSGVHRRHRVGVNTLRTLEQKPSTLVASVKVEHGPIKGKLEERTERSAGTLRLGHEILIAQDVDIAGKNSSELTDMTTATSDGPGCLAETLRRKIDERRSHGVTRISDNEDKSTLGEDSTVPGRFVTLE